MQLRWTEEAANDLEHIIDYLFEHAPDRAAGLVRTVYDAPAGLLTFPNRGRLGNISPLRQHVSSAPTMRSCIDGPTNLWPAELELWPELSDAARSCGGGGRLTTYCERNQELRLWRHRIRIIASAAARAWLGGAGRAVV